MHWGWRTIFRLTVYNDGKTNEIKLKHLTQLTEQNCLQFIYYSKTKSLKLIVSKPIQIDQFILLNLTSLFTLFINSEWVWNDISDDAGKHVQPAHKWYDLIQCSNENLFSNKICYVLFMTVEHWYIEFIYFHSVSCLMLSSVRSYTFTFTNNGLTFFRPTSSERTDPVPFLYGVETITSTSITTIIIISTTTTTTTRQYIVNG